MSTRYYLSPQKVSVEHFDFKDRRLFHCFVHPLSSRRAVTSHFFNPHVGLENVEKRRNEPWSRFRNERHEFGRRDVLS